VIENSYFLRHMKTLLYKLSHKMNCYKEMELYLMIQRSNLLKPNKTLRCTNNKHTI
jgi:hypothetical protein